MSWFTSESSLRVAAEAYHRALFKGEGHIVRFNGKEIENLSAQHVLSDIDVSHLK